MTDLIPFDFDGQAVRVVTVDGEPWFVAADVTALLGYSNGRMAIGSLPDRMRNTVTIRDGIRGNPERTVLNEAGVNRLIMRSTLPEAERVQDWLAEVVLPSIRRTGSYAKQDVSTLAARDILAIAQRLVEQEERAQQAEVRAERSERIVGAIEAAEGLTPTQFHKHYFSDVRATDFFENLYSLRLLIDQRGARGRDAQGHLKNGHQHGHPAATGKAFFYLHGRLDAKGERRESVRVRPGRAEVELVEFLASRGLPANTNALTTSLPKEIAA